MYVLLNNETLETVNLMTGEVACLNRSDIKKTNVPLSKYFETANKSDFMKTIIGLGSQALNAYDIIDSICLQLKVADALDGEAVDVSKAVLREMVTEKGIEFKGKHFEVKIECIDDKYIFRNLRTTELSEFRIPWGITDIGSPKIKSPYEDGFVGCCFEASTVKEIVIPNTVVCIGKEAFRRSWFEHISVPSSVIEMHAKVFADCCNLLSAEIVGGVTFLPSKAFYRCTFLKRVYLGYGIYSVGASAFSGCSMLTDVVFGLQNNKSTLQVLYPNVFKGCVSLTNIDLPEGLRGIEDKCFAGCKALKSINIPQTVHYLGVGVFNDCVDIKSLKLSNNIKELRGNSDGWADVYSLILPSELTYIDLSVCFNYVCTTLIMRKIDKPFELVTVNKDGVEQRDIPRWRAYLMLLYEFLSAGIALKEVVLATELFVPLMAYKELRAIFVKLFEYSLIQFSVECAFDGDLSFTHTSEWQDNFEFPEGLYFFGSTDYVTYKIPEVLYRACVDSFGDCKIANNIMLIPNATDILDGLDVLY